MSFWLRALCAFALTLSVRPALARTDAPALNRVTSVKVDETSMGRVVDITCERDPVFTVFRLSDPVRIVIDIARGDVSKLDGPIEIDDGVVGDIAVAQFSDDRNALGRLIIHLAKSFDYEVKQQGNHVRLSVRGDGGPAPVALPKVAAEPVKVAAVPAAKVEAPKGDAKAEAAKKEELAKAEAAKREELAKAEAAKREELAKAEAAKREDAAKKAELAKADAARKDELAKADAAKKAELAKAEEARKLEEVRVAAAEKLKKEQEAEKAKVELAKSAGSEKSVHEIATAVVDKTLDRVTVKKSKKSSEVLVHISGGKPAYEILELEDPPRVVFDFSGVSTKLPKSSNWNLGAVGKLRLGIHHDKVRLVLDGAGALPQYEIDSKEGLVRITTALKQKEPEPAPIVAAAPPPPPEPKPAPVEPKPEPIVVPEPKPVTAKESSTLVSTLDVKKIDDRAQLRLSVPDSATFEVDHSVDRAPTLAITGVSFAKELEKSSDVSKMGTGLIRLTSFNERRGKGGVRIIANLATTLTDRVFREGKDLVWEFEQRAKGPTSGLVAVAPAPPPPAPEPVKVSMQPAADVAGFASEATQLVRATSTQATGGRRIGVLDVRNMDLLNLLRYISEVSGENIIAGDDVTGKITLRLRNVSWEHALDAALQTKGYGRVRQGGIIRVAPLKKLQEEKEQELARKKAEEQVAPTFVRLIPINYAQAKDILEQVKPVLTKDRGKATVDERTNTIVAEDLAEVLNKIENLARRLDTQTPQVLIESRIVEANTQHVRDIGIQWGGSNLFSAATGNATGLAFPNLLGFAGGSDDAQTRSEGTGAPPRFAVNLPAPVGSGAGGSMGFIFGNAANTALLSLRLSALENNGSVRIVSAPKVTTLDNVRARISQGVSIPISVTSAAGVNTRFIDAFLELEVRPHVTQDGSIMMEIKASKNEPDFSRTGAAGDPTIQKKVAETQVLVKDGDTTVIGGIYTRNTTVNFNEVPFLSKIPVLGWLFKRKRESDDRAELLVFITPRIVNRQQSSVVSGGGL